MQSELRKSPKGSFKILSKESSTTLYFVTDATIEQETIDWNQDTARIAAEGQSFFSLSAFVAFHLCEKGSLPIILNRASVPTLLRSLFLTAAGTTVSNAFSRIDKKALSAKYFLGGVPEETAIKVRKYSFCFD